MTTFVQLVRVENTLKKATVAFQKNKTITNPRALIQSLFTT